MNTETVQIDLLGRQYTLNVPVEEKECLRQAVHLLSQKMNVVQQNSSTMDTDLMIIIGALNLIHDFLKIKNSEGLDLSEFRSKIVSMADKCKAHLPD